jgi:hypothetical protein
MRPILCPICRNDVGERVAVCRDCETPHHTDCWEWAEGCAVFGCRQARARVLDRPVAEAPVELVIVDDGGWEAPGPGPSPRRARVESAAVVWVSWLYLAFSLAAAVPALGAAAHGLTGGIIAYLVAGALFALVALTFKQLGDRIATGEPCARRQHLSVCALVALLFGRPGWLLAGVLAAPFLTRRGNAHFD